MTPILCFDIETIPDVAGLRRLHDWPDSMADAEVAQRCFDARREKNGSDFLPHHLQRVLVISCLFRDDDGLRVKSLDGSGGNEGKAIGDFFRIVEKYTPTIVSWNGGGFDLPVLHYRGMVNAVQAPRYWDMGEDDRDFKWNNYISRYHSRHTDLMDLLALYQGRANAPLDDLAKLCGFPGKLGMDGSQVWAGFQRGELEAIRDYCETDVMNTYLVYCRFQLMRGALSASAYQQEMELLRSTVGGWEQAHWKEFLAAWKN